MQVCECMVQLLRFHPLKISLTFWHKFGGNANLDANIPRARAYTRAPYLYFKTLGTVPEEGMRMKTSRFPRQGVRGAATCRESCAHKSRGRHVSML